jgi:hypothetical protein
MMEKAMVSPEQVSAAAARFGLEGLDVVPEPDRAEIVTTLGALFTGFAQRNADLLTDVYTADADWVNAFGSVKNGVPRSSATSVACSPTRTSATASSPPLRAACCAW